MRSETSLRSLTQRLRGLRNFILSGSLARGFLTLAGAAGILLIVAFALQATFFLSITSRSVFVALSAVVLVSLIALYLIVPLIRRPSLESVALRVEQQFPQLQDRLIASLQLERNLFSNREGFSTELIQGVIRQSDQMCGDLNFREAADHSALKRISGYFGGTAAVVLLIALLFPGNLRDTLYVFSHPTMPIERHLTYALDVQPKDVEVAKYEPLTIEALLAGRSLPAAAKLHWRYEDGPVMTEDLQRSRVVRSAGITERLNGNDSVRMAYDFREVRRSFKYWVTAGEIESPEYVVEAVDKPRVIGIKLTYNYPKYTGLQPLVVDENDGNISAIKGTTVEVEAAVNKDVETAQLVLNNASEQPLEIKQHRLVGTVKVMEDAKYHIAVTDKLGHNNPNPIEYRIGAIADLYPEADLYRPGVPIELSDRMAIDLGVKLFDDFGFSALNLVYRVYSPYGETFERKQQVPFQRSGRSLDVAYLWDVGDIGLEPGGMIEYYFEVFDNDDVSGPKRGVSQVLAARFPSLDEQFAYLEEEGEAQISELEELRRTQEQLLENTQKLQQELLTNTELDWERRQELQKALDTQQNMFDQLDKIGERLEQMQEQMRKNDLTSLEVLQKLEEIKKLFDQVATEQMKEAMKKLQEALEKMSPEELAKAAEQMEMSQEELLEKLERTLALLKFLQAQQKMENMMRQLADLIEKQEQVNEQTEASQEHQLPQLASQEERNRKQFETLQKQADELEQMLKELNLDKNEEAQKFMESLRKSDAGNKMDLMTQQLRREQKGESQQTGEAILDELQSMQQKMQEAKDNFSGQQGQMAAEKMREAANEVLYVSERQEDVLSQAEQLDPTAPQLQQLAAEQQALQRTLDALDGKLKDISKESPFYSTQISEFMKQARELMSKSTDALSRRNCPSAMRYQKDAMFSLNQAANQLMQSMQNQKMCNNGRCSNENMFQKMNQMAKQQQQLNNQSSQMCDQGNAKPSPSDLGRLASQQDAIRKSLGQLQQEQGNRREILGRLDELGKEVKKVVEDLEVGKLDESVLERQYKIHSRMLDFQRSLERQDFSEERKAERAEDILRRSPQQLQFGLDNRESFQDRLQKFMNEGYPPEYEELIKEYFRSVNSGQTNK